MEDIQLIHGDCLVEMQNIPDKSVDCILCDLPYGQLNKGNKHAAWDVVNLRRYKLTEMCKIAKNLCDWLGRKCNGLNLNDCQKIKEAYHELDKVLTNISVIENAIIKAEELKNVV